MAIQFSFSSVKLGVVSAAHAQIDSALFRRNMLTVHVAIYFSRERAEASLDNSLELRQFTYDVLTDSQQFSVDSLYAALLADPFFAGGVSTPEVR